MRILQVIQESSGGGAERIVQGLARHHRAAGHAVEVVASGSGGSFELPLLLRKPWRVPAATRSIRKAIEEWGADLVHAHNPAIGLCAGRALRRMSCVGLVTLHGIPDRDYTRAARLLKHGGLPVVACAPGVAAALEEHGLSPLRTILNGIGPLPAPVDRSKLNQLFEIAAHHKVMTVVGRLDPVKNQALAIDALARLEDVTLLLIGEGPERLSLQRRAAKKGLIDRVVFAGDRADAPALVGAADVAVSPSRSEGLPLAVLEAMGMGTPLVSTHVRGLRGLLENGSNAVIVPPGDVQGLAQAIRAVLDDRDLADRLASEGRRFASAHDEAAMASSYMQVYELLATRSPPAGGQGRVSRDRPDRNGPPNGRGAP